VYFIAFRIPDFLTKILRNQEILLGQQVNLFYTTLEQTI